MKNLCKCRSYLFAFFVGVTPHFTISIILATLSFFVFIIQLCRGWPQPIPLPLLPCRFQSVLHALMALIWAFLQVYCHRLATDRTRAQSKTTFCFSWTKKDPYSFIYSSSECLCYFLFWPNLQISLVSQPLVCGVLNRQKANAVCRIALCLTQ